MTTYRSITITTKQNKRTKKKLKNFSFWRPTLDDLHRGSKQTSVHHVERSKGRKERNPVATVATALENPGDTKKTLWTWKLRECVCVSALAVVVSYNFPLFSLYCSCYCFLEDEEGGVRRKEERRNWRLFCMCMWCRDGVLRQREAGRKGTHPQPRKKGSRQNGFEQ